MKPIQTLYRDHLFRSRLEARFAVFFDALGQKWEYEKEGYDLDGDYYLPDFYLPGLSCFIEIKGQIPETDEIRKCRKLQFFTEKDVAIFHGLPMENEGLLFNWDDQDGGRFNESHAQWEIDDGCLGFTDFPNGTARELKQAASRAKQARFEHGHQPEFRASRPLVSVVNYDDIAF